MFGFREKDKAKALDVSSKTIQVAPAPSIDYRVPHPMHTGHKLYECNMETGVLDEVKYHSRMIDFVSKDMVKVYIHKKQCYYIPALNEENAMKKLKKLHSKVGFKIIETTVNKKAHATA